MAPGGPLRTRYQVDDLLQAREWVEQAYGAQLQVKAEDGERSTRMTIDHIHTDELDLIDVNVPLDVGFDVQGQGQYVFMVQHAGAVEIERGKEVRRFVAGDVFAGIRPIDQARSRNAYADLSTVSLPTWLLEETVELSGGRALGSWTFGSHAVTKPAADRWRRTTTLVRQLLADVEADPAPLVQAQAVRLLAATALATFPVEGLDHEERDNIRDAHPATLRRAIAFIESHPDQPISVVDIARASHVTPRAVQLAFRRHLDTTPMTYLRRVRLERAHVDLQTADPGEATVTAIASRWGFANPGRFAGYYLAAYGRPPKSTLDDQ